MPLTKYLTRLVQEEKARTGQITLPEFIPTFMGDRNQRPTFRMIDRLPVVKLIEEGKLIAQKESPRSKMQRDAIMYKINHLLKSGFGNLIEAEIKK